MQWYIEYTRPDGGESATTITGTRLEVVCFVNDMEEAGAIVTKVVQEKD